MGKILAVDFGQKRAGFAITDELKMIAMPLNTVHVSKVFDFIKEKILKENVETIVIGEPKNMNNKPSESMRFIEPFINRLKKEIDGIPIVRFDERFTSKMAFQSMIDAGLSKKRRSDKALVDKISATLILQSYLLNNEITNNR